MKVVAASVVGAPRTWHPKKSWLSTAAWQSPVITVLRATRSRLARPRVGLPLCTGFLTIKLSCTGQFCNSPRHHRIQWTTTIYASKHVCMYVFMLVNVYIYIYISYVFMYMCMSVYIDMYEYIYIYIYMYVYIYIMIFFSKNVRIYIYIYIYITFSCICVIYIYIYI